jgi:hypothetical protein
VAALVAITPTIAGTASTGAAVAASDTIAQSIMGPNGATLEIINNGGSVDNITISDTGLTPAGNALTGGTYAVSVTNGTSKVFDLSNLQVNPTTNLITITHSFTTTVTYKLYPVG